LSESDVVGKIKDLMPYIIVAVVLVCLTVLRATDQIAEDKFWQVFLLVIGYAIGDVTNIIRFRRLRKLLRGMESPK
jgi:hypothetical protein